MNVTVLACASGLLLVLALYIRIALDGFSVRDLLRHCHYIYAELVFELGCNDAELDLALSAEKRLMRLNVSFEYE